MLKVKFRGVLRGAYGGEGGQKYPSVRWKILFNDSHCQNPGWIESAHWNEDNDVSHHKSSGSKITKKLFTQFTGYILDVTSVSL